MDKLIELSSLSAGYNGSLILKDINLTIYRNDFLGIIGPNGGGKTTLLRIILGLLKPAAGNITVYDKSLKGSRKAIGYLPQFRAVDRHFPVSVSDVVFSGLSGTAGKSIRLSKEVKEKAYSMMNRFGIYTLKNRPIGELSGGQMQRVFMCRALVSTPLLLILDEPDTFIDTEFSLNLNQTLHELNDKMTIILVSHDIGTIISSVKNIACVNNSLHYHSSDEFTPELLEHYKCPIHIVGHGDFPHTILKKHNN